MWQCVNSLLRASSISTVNMLISELEAFLCQFPSTGFLHFYADWIGKIRWNHGVSIPFYGLPPFLRNQSFSLRNDSGRVNSLLRASSISTVASQSPLKSRLSRLIFAGIYLNILTIYIFALFFCLFKNCTKKNTIFPFYHMSIISYRSHWLHPAFFIALITVWLQPMASIVTIVPDSSINLISTLSQYRYRTIPCISVIRN